MKKDIYIIKNRINDKVYIGQTVNPTQRWAQYKTEAKKRPENQLITRAMRLYGFDNFYMEIIESNIENYDEREIYWIQYYNSLAPNGYNLVKGGQGTGSGIEAVSSVIKSQELLDSIIEDLLLDDLSLKAISKKYGISYGVISELNQGHTYYNPDLAYPIRKNNKYSDEKIKQITYSLKYELDKSLHDIAKEYNCDHSFLNDINQGRAYFRDYLTYPIRKGKMKRQLEYLPLLLNDLIYTTIPQNELAKKYQISKQTVSEVNTGKRGYQENINYPIRGDKERGRTCFSPNEIQEIYHQLRDTKKSICEIAREWGVSPTTIQNINKGKTKKYYSPEIKYPIRKK